MTIDHDKSKESTNPGGDYIQIGDIVNSTVAVGARAKVVGDHLVRYHLDGDFRGAIVNIESTLSEARQAVIGLARADDAQVALIALIQDLKDVLVSVQEEQLSDALELAEHATMLIQVAASDQPSHSTLQALGQRLKEAGRRLGQSLPRVLEVTEQLVSVTANISNIVGT